MTGSNAPAIHHDPLGAVVVGIDGSDPSRRALAWAAEQARVTGRTLLAITTWEWPASYGAVVAWPSDISFEEDARRALREAVGQTLDPGVASQVVQQVVHGHPAPVLRDASRTAELVVIGNRGHGEFAGMLLGSVSEFLTTHAECPVVVVRHCS